jgi:3-oxoacyl-[acyl-carrier protein] reductase
MTAQRKPHILITGAATGIGAACARKLASPRNLLCLHTGTNEDGLARLAEELRSGTGGEIHCFTADFTDAGASLKLIDDIRKNAGHIDQMILNAGYAEKSDFEHLSDTSLRQALAVMAESPARLISAFIEDIKHSPYGRIVSISSFVTSSSGVTDAYFTATAAAKGALEALTMNAARQCKAHQATANIISPGYTRKDSRKSALTDAQWQNLSGRLPLGRLIEPDEIASLASFLLSEQGAMITGQNIAVDSGLNLL